MEDVESITEQSESQASDNTNSEDVAKLLNETWQHKFEELSKQYEERLAERDGVIRQLINSGTTDNESNVDSIVEKINNQRKFKKW